MLLIATVMLVMPISLGLLTCCSNRLRRSLAAKGYKDRLLYLLSILLGQGPQPVYTNPLRIFFASFAVYCFLVRGKLMN